MFERTKAEKSRSRDAIELLIKLSRMGRITVYGLIDSLRIVGPNAIVIVTLDGDPITGIAVSGDVVILNVSTGTPIKAGQLMKELIDMHRDLFTTYKGVPIGIETNKQTINLVCREKASINDLLKLLADAEIMLSSFLIENDYPFMSLLLEAKSSINAARSLLYNVKG